MNDLFLLEQNASEVERGFLRALYKDRNDKFALAAYGDWLEEHGRTIAATELRKGNVPGFGRSYGGYTYQPVVSGMVASGYLHLS